MSQQNIDDIQREIAVLEGQLRFAHGRLLDALVELTVKPVSDALDEAVDALKSLYDPETGPCRNAAKGFKEHDEARRIIERYKDSLTTPPDAG